MEKFVFVGKEGKPETNSLLIAKKFGRKHKTVMREIRRLVALAKENGVKEDDISDNLFTLSECEDRSGEGIKYSRNFPIYIVHTDGFYLWASEFATKENYGTVMECMNDFHRAEEGLEETSVSMSPLEALEYLIHTLVEHEKRLNNIESKIEEFNKRIKSLESARAKK